MVRETQKQSEAHPEDPPVSFGVGIHTGEVIAGNLSSNQNIDYTIVGKNVNLVARIEELTKIAKVSKIIGTNGILLTSEAVNDLKLFANSQTNSLDLEEIQLKVRSFPGIKSVKYFKSSEGIEIANKTTVKRMTNPKLPLNT